MPVPHLLYLSLKISLLVASVRLGEGLDPSDTVFQYDTIENMTPQTSV